MPNRRTTVTRRRFILEEFEHTVDEHDGSFDGPSPRWPSPRTDSEASASCSAEAPKLRARPKGAALPPHGEGGISL